MPIEAGINGLIGMVRVTQQLADAITVVLPQARLLLL
jgi:hypothetical protein